MLPELKHFFLTPFPECPFKPFVFKEDNYTKEWMALAASGTSLHLLEHNALQNLQALLTVHVNIGVLFPFISFFFSSEMEKYFYKVLLCINDKTSEH